MVATLAKYDKNSVSYGIAIFHVNFDSFNAILIAIDGDLVNWYQTTMSLL